MSMSDWFTIKAAVRQLQHHSAEGWSFTKALELLCAFISLATPTLHKHHKICTTWVGHVV